MLVQVLDDQSRSEPVNVLCQAPCVPRVGIRYFIQLDYPGDRVQVAWTTHRTSPLG